MNRILFEPAEIGPDCRAVFGGVRAEHVRTVLKGTVGQILKTGVIGGEIGQSVIEAISQESVTVQCTHDRPPLPPWCDLVLAPPRPRAMKRLLPHLATIGVRRVFLVGAEKVEKAFWGAQLLKPEIYRPLLVEGLMQGAVSTEPPEIRQVRNFKRWLDSGDFERDFPEQDKRIVAHPYSMGTVPEGTVGTDPEGIVGTVPEGAVGTDPGNMGTVPVFAIGPEGGWTDAEVAMLEAHGFTRYALGSRILKTETAAIALLSRFL